VPGAIGYTEDMITALTGDNSFAIRERVLAIIAEFGGEPERIDGAALELRQLPDVLMGSSLFAEKRLVILSDLSSNKQLWEKLPDWLPRVSDDIHLVLVDEKLDKRTLSYKALAKATSIETCAEWTPRDTSLAEAWAVNYAQERGAALDRASARHLVSRVGAHQWTLAQAIEKLSVLDTISPAIIDEVIEATPSENVFAVFEMALEGRSRDVVMMLKTLTLQQDPYMFFALLSSQALQLAAVAAAGEQQQPAKDFGIHPFVASKLTRHVRQLGKRTIFSIVQLFANADADMKVSKAEPWILIEQVLLRTAATADK